MKESIIYPRFYKCATLAEFKLLDTKCCVLLGLPNDEDTNDYANPIVDIQGFNWLVVNPDISSLFTESEILAMVQFDEIELPIVNP
tara:strand:+ start:268 stop:525 length:258 start_codon:yes stop_codon:yes gene_type:complete